MFSTTRIRFHTIKVRRRKTLLTILMYGMRKVSKKFKLLNILKNTKKCMININQIKILKYIKPKTTTNILI